MEHIIRQESLHEFVRTVLAYDPLLADEAFQSNGRIRSFVPNVEKLYARRDSRLNAEDLVVFYFLDYTSHTKKTIKIRTTYEVKPYDSMSFMLNKIREEVIND